MDPSGLGPLMYFADGSVRIGLRLCRAVPSKESIANNNKHKLYFGIPHPYK